MNIPKRKSAEAIPSKLGASTQAVLGDVNCEGKIPAKWRWHFKTLLELRQSLTELQRGQASQATETVEPHSMSMADSATDEFDHALALAELSNTQNGLWEIEQAIRRIKAGTYGVCEESGERISAARLRAIPWTRFSVEVEDRLEKEGAITPAQLAKAHSVREALESAPQNGALSSDGAKAKHR